MRGHFCRKFCEYLETVMKNKERIKGHILGEPCKPYAVYHGLNQNRKRTLMKKLVKSEYSLKFT